MFSFFNKASETVTPSHKGWLKKKKDIDNIDDTIKTTDTNIKDIPINNKRRILLNTDITVSEESNSDDYQDLNHNKDNRDIIDTHFLKDEPIKKKQKINKKHHYDDNFGDCKNDAKKDGKKKYTQKQLNEKINKRDIYVVSPPSPDHTIVHGGFPNGDKKTPYKKKKDKDTDKYENNIVQNRYTRKNNNFTGVKRKYDNSYNIGEEYDNIQKFRIDDNVRNRMEKLGIKDYDQLSDAQNWLKKTIITHIIRRSDPVHNFCAILAAALGGNCKVEHLMTVIPKDWTEYGDESQQPGDAMDDISSFVRGIINATNFQSGHEQIWKTIHDILNLIHRGNYNNSASNSFRSQNMNNNNTHTQNHRVNIVKEWISSVRSSKPISVDLESMERDSTDGEPLLGFYFLKPEVNGLLQISLEDLNIATGINFFLSDIITSRGIAEKFAQWVAVRKALLTPAPIEKYESHQQNTPIIRIIQPNTHFSMQLLRETESGIIDYFLKVSKTSNGLQYNYSSKNNKKNKNSRHAYTNINVNNKSDMDKLSKEGIFIFD